VEDEPTFTYSRFKHDGCRMMAPKGKRTELEINAGELSVGIFSSKPTDSALIQDYGNVIP